MTKETLAPVLRVQDTDAAIAWYERLGFGVDYQHSSGPALSRTVAVLKRGELVLLLSNRDEDTPSSNSVVYLRVADVAPIANEFVLPVQNLQSGALIGRQVELRDPDGNRILVADFTPAPKPWSDSG